MMSPMSPTEHLREVLQRVHGARDVQVVRDGTKLIGTVVSPTFVGQDEYRRQEAVWQLLLAELSDDELAQVGFVFTNTPEEHAAPPSQPA